MTQMDCRETIASGVLESRVLLERYLVGFDDTNHTRQAEHLPNHVAWTLGHLAHTLYRIAERLDGSTPPGDGIDFASDDPACDAARTRSAGVDGRRTRFHSESVAFNSKPVSDPSLYPSMARSQAILKDACEHFAKVVRAMPEERIVAMVPWGAMEIPAWSAGMRMVFHNGTHCGQIADLRRALGMKSIFA
jgi:hypothetical protein